MRIVVLGAGGQLGREVVSALVKRGHQIGAVVRRSPDPLFDSAVEVRRADARNKDEIRSAISGFNAVVNVIGGGTLRRNEVASSATAVVVPAVKAARIKRYIAMSAEMV